VTIHKLAHKVVPKDDCCSKGQGCAFLKCPVGSASISTRKAHPCCDSVVPFTSVSEHQRIVVEHLSGPAMILPGYQPSLLQSQFVEGKLVPPPADVGIEIITLILRI
jgi:hypothetical protein